ncbi:MAG: D-glycerate 2-kinase [Acidobacteria bacterium]|nr:D-glycerate 2-kinase [Acidobacteriota bacterium]
MNSTSELRNIALEIFHRTLARIDVGSVVRAYARLNDDRLAVGDEEIELARFKRVIVIAIGKASVPMARAVEHILGARISGGLVATNAVIGKSPRLLPVIIGGHPLPNEGSLEAASKALEILRSNDADDTLVLFLISGGGSALFENPIDEAITLDDLRTINRVLVDCGAVIAEMNVVRRFLSAVKGGRLAAAAPRSRQISLYISDVNSDDLSTISSGPTLPSAATREEFDRIVERYDLLDKFPAHVAALIAGGELPDLPRAKAEDADRRSHHLLLDNRKALLEAKRIAESDFGCVVEIAEDLVEGDVEAMALTHVERVVALRHRRPGKIVCLLSGGEAICPVRGDGQGGRNQEFVLRAAIHLHQRGLPDVVALSAGTDGIDGNSPADGAIADVGTLRRAEEKNILAEELLQNSDSFNFFNALGDAIITGPTGNNVRDLRILLAR